MSAENVSPIRRNDQSMSSETFTTHDKALRINLDPSKYGTCVEIGAGQEVARWFFRVGGAAGTVAKPIPAYGLAGSGARYGPPDRYLHRPRPAGLGRRREHPDGRPSGVVSGHPEIFLVFVANGGRA